MVAAHSPEVSSRAAGAAMNSSQKIPTPTPAITQIGLGEGGSSTSRIGEGR
ncbi:Uncharacterised protein [Mycobacteroides abscessus subsp. abscessus]|nr:Uncharacterised protein [Mycobacteroides abscessus subsp. abscessus]